MSFYHKVLGLKTNYHTEFVNITDYVNEAVEESNIKNGQVLVQSKHTTTGVIVNENEERLHKDIEYYLNNVAPKHNGYMHDDITERNCPEDEPLNAHSHIKSALYSKNSETISLKDGLLELGKWQNIFFAEYDGPCPRNNKSIRKCIVNILGE
ncbi:secondary thiamine-phosphate synthase enzyme [Candidatus Woesearchaeota archaeon]|jgi:secondary thiamine-phosphate synthase enzyme|nr:secondary thiamine-phosphate synthase enzyme [Candidatus Woesearchaeota archaeon]|tara:strand:+ start:2095 stop:2553 length:459 start_codon:yes stop_codon:yes gene_type:complete